MRILAFGLAFALGLVLCEIALRLFAPVPFHEWVEWEPEGHITGRYVPNQVVLTATGHEFRVNKHGFRGPDYSFEKPEGTLRIEVFGGSAALCYKAAGREKSWPGALEIKLREHFGMPVEVINLGLAGFDSFTSKINYLCYGRAFQPDAILVYHTWNDMGRIRRREKEPYWPAPIPRNKSLLQRAARTTQLGRRLHFALSIQGGRQMDIMATEQEGTGADMDRPVPEYALAWERQNFADFCSWARADGVLPILVTQAGLAAPENIDDPEVRRHMAGGAVNRGYTLRRAVETWLRISEIIEDVARDCGAVFVDGYAAVPHDLEHVRDNVHLFDKGSEVLAQAIFDVLVDDERFLSVVERVRAERSSPEIR